MNKVFDRERERERNRKRERERKRTRERGERRMRVLYPEKPATNRLQNSNDLKVD